MSAQEHAKINKSESYLSCFSFINPSNRLAGRLIFPVPCALITMTRQNNLMVYRENSKTDKIDPLIATIIALSAATLGKVEKSVYDDRDILIF